MADDDEEMHKPSASAPPPATAPLPSANDNDEAAKLEQRARTAHAAYGRGKQIALKQIKDKKRRRELQRLEERYQDAALKAKDAEILLEHSAGFLEAENALERTYRVRQDEIAAQATAEAAKKRFELKLDGKTGPYIAEYSRNGASLLLAGRRGHVAGLDWRAGKLGCEIQLGETVRDARFLHNDNYFALAQKSSVYIYDRSGVELHDMKKLGAGEPLHLDFLPYHFLLVAATNTGYLKYADTSTGRIVAELNSKLGAPTAMAHSPYNAIVHLGHQNGVVSLWSPNSSGPLAKLLCHRGPVRALALSRDGRHLVTAGQDQKMGVWDVRNFKEMHTYFLRKPGTSASISDTGLTALACGTQAVVWKGLFDGAKVQAPYLSWSGEGKAVERVRFCPFEDVLGVGHAQGFSSLIVPGAGEANFDALELNPYETVRQRQEGEVKALLNKLQPEMISLDPDFVGNLDLASHEKRAEAKDLDRPAIDEVKALKNRGRGKNSSLRKYLRKKGSRNIIDERRERIEALRKETNRRTRKIPEKSEAEKLGPALARFARKG